MILQEADLVDLTTIVWDTLVGTVIEVTDAPSPAGDPGSMVSSVEISGEWSGVVSLACSGLMVRDLAAVMFGADPDTVDEDAAIDAAAELANIVAGYVKAMSDLTCEMSLPAVVSGAEYAAAQGSELLLQASFLCDGEPWTISVHSLQSVPET